MIYKELFQDRTVLIKGTVREISDFLKIRKDSPKPLEHKTEKNDVDNFEATNKEDDVQEEVVASDFTPEMEVGEQHGGGLMVEELPSVETAREPIKKRNYRPREYAQEVLDLIFQRRSHGENYELIARELNQKGYLSAQGKQWHMSAVRNIVKNRYFLVNGLVDSETFSKANRKFPKFGKGRGQV